MTRRPTSSIRSVALRLVPAPAEPAVDLKVRPERIAQARERIRRRYYDRADVTRALVESLLADFAAPR